jgi:preprotein translocase subunit YajC
MVFSATIFLILDAAATGVKAPTQMEQMFQTMQLPLLLLVVFYFLLIRPQQKQRKEQQKLIEALKTGDKVVTSSGIHGMISNVKDRTVLLKVADNVKIEIDKAAVATVLARSAEESAESAA